MIKVLFVCLGNICRSPMGEYIFRSMVTSAGLSGEFLISSSATSREELGNPIYPPARRKLREHGIEVTNHRARLLTREDYDRYDYLIGMEQYNIRSMLRIVGADPEHKIARLLDFTDFPRDIADPWFTDDFDTAYREIHEGCEALLQTLLQKRAGH